MCVCVRDDMFDVRVEKDKLRHRYPQQCVAVCCSVLQCVVVCCSLLQCFAAHRLACADQASALDR